jgi:hypothetical protein
LAASSIVEIDLAQPTVEVGNGVSCNLGPGGKSRVLDLASCVADSSAAMAPTRRLLRARPRM